MKIIYISNSIIPSRTANSIHVAKMSNALLNIGNEVHLIGIKSQNVDNIHEFYGIEKKLKIKTFKIFPIFGKTYLYALRSSIYAKRMRPHIVITRSLQACYFSILLKMEVIFETHSPLYSSDNNVINNKMFKRILRSKRLHKVVTITEKLKNELIKSHHIDPEKIMVFSDCADLADDKYVIIDPKLLEYKFNIGYIGHLYKGRGIDLIYHLSKEFDHIGFHIIGGNANDIEYWNKRSEGQKNFILHGFIKPARIGSYYKYFDILLAPYERDVKVSGNCGNTANFMSPLKIFEYMASKTAIIASNIPVLLEVLEDHKNCILCEQNDLASWKKAVELLYYNKKLRHDIALSAFNDFERKYTWNIRAKKILTDI